MTLSRDVLKRILLVTVISVAAFRALCLWNKHDFCSGWAEHHAALSTRLRAEAQSGSLSRVETKEYLVAAEGHKIVAGKWAAAALPWAAYPTAPLASPAELAAAEQRIEK